MKMMYNSCLHDMISGSINYTVNGLKDIDKGKSKEECLTEATKNKSEIFVNTTLLLTMWLRLSSRATWYDEGESKL